MTVPAVNGLCLTLSLKGRPIKTYTFFDEEVTIGRTPEADLFLDNPGVSREHATLERQGNSRLRLTDHGSANGTFLNGNRVETAMVGGGDVIQIGKFSITCEFAQDRRSRTETGRGGHDPNAAPGTTVLSNEQLKKVLDDPDRAPTAADMQARPRTGVIAALKPTSAGQSPRRRVTGAVMLSFLVGGAVGAAATWWLLGPGF